MIRLSELAAGAPPPSAPALSLSSLVAEPHFAPREWQTVAPDACYAGRKQGVEMSPDLERILALPRRDVPEAGSPRAEALIDVLSERFRRDNPRCACAEIAPERDEPCITRLRRSQAWTLYEIGLDQGALGSIMVGDGKTILNILAALAMPECRCALLLVPPNLIHPQLVSDYALISQHFRVPSLIVHDKTAHTVLVDGAPTLHVLPYSRLSRPESTAFLEVLRPDTIIADEVDRLRHADTAGTSRVLRYFAAHPETRFCGWTGSLTNTSPRDYGHLAALALRMRSPVPIDVDQLDAWCRALDPKAPFPAPPGALLDLCEPGEHLYEGFRRRVSETRGFITTTEPSVSAALVIDERPAPEIPDSVEEALALVRGEWRRPDGEELVDALAMVRCAQELACGFFYRWRFPRIQGAPQERATIEAWLEARKNWRRELRVKLRAREEHLDSDKLCALAAMRAHEQIPNPDGLPVWKSVYWPEWSRVKKTVVYETEPVRLDPYLAEDAAEWALSNRGIVWYQHTDFGRWVAELSGLPLHGGGPNAGADIMRERGDRSIIASISSHGRGRNGLQFLFSEQLVANPPSDPTRWEQTLGRLHRPGQKAPVVRALVYRHTDELAQYVDDALKRAAYVQGTLGANQKLITGWRL